MEVFVRIVRSSSRMAPVQFTVADCEGRHLFRGTEAELEFWFGLELPEQLEPSGNWLPVVESETNWEW